MSEITSMSSYGGAYSIGGIIGRTGFIGGLIAGGLITGGLIIGLGFGFFSQTSLCYLIRSSGKIRLQYLHLV